MCVCDSQGGLPVGLVLRHSVCQVFHQAHDTSWSWVQLRLAQAWVGPSRSQTMTPCCDVHVPGTKQPSVYTATPVALTAFAVLLAHRLNHFFRLQTRP